MRQTGFIGNRHIVQKHRVLTLCFFSFLLISSTLTGQDAHYWTNQYGTRAELLGGIVIGSVKDLSATFYNPGTIALTTDRSFVLSTQAFNISNTTIKDGFDIGEDQSYTILRQSPGLFAVRLAGDSTSKHHLAVSVMTKDDFEFDLTGRTIYPDGMLPQFQNQFAVSSELKYYTKLTDSWGGFSWALLFNQELSLGLTQFVGIRSQSGRYQSYSNALLESGNSVMDNYFTEYSYWNVRTFTKFGIVWNQNPLTIGLTLTTPSLNLFGTGWVSFSDGNSIVSNIDSSVSSKLVANYQEDIDSYYRSPFSIGLGTSYRFGKTSVHFSMEWFDAVSEITVLNAKDYYGQTDQQRYRAKIAHQLKSVTNYGLGIEHRFHEELSVYLSFASNYSAKIDEIRTPLAISNWDIYNLSLGSALTIYDFDITLGLSYSFGTDETENYLANLPEDISQIGIRIQPNKQIQYRRLKVIVGFSL